jgi:magnesium transporter
MTEAVVQRPHHQHLEQSRAQVIELLSRQAVERDIVSRSEGRRQDVVSELVARQQQAQLEQRLAQFHPADIAFVLESLTPEAREMAWSLVRAERRGAVLLETSDVVRRALITGMPAQDIASVVRPLDADEIADLIGGLPEAQRQEVLQQLDRENQAEVRSVLSFPEGSVGASMDLDIIAVRDDASLEAVHRLLRRRRHLPPHTNQVFVVDRGNVLIGLLPVSKLLLEEPEALVGDVMTREPVFFYTDDPIDNAVDAFEKYNWITAPVVNLHQQLVGRLIVDTVLDLVQHRAASESLRQVGLSEDEDLFAPAKLSARNRWPWLALNLFTAFIASRVIGAFEPIIAQLVALAALMPIVASIGGNTGTQTMALMIRGLALNQLGSTQLRQMFVKECKVAAINGALWGTVLGGLTLMLYQDIRLSIVIAVAVLGNLLVAATAGVLIPLTLHRFGRDPVMGSGVMLTALTDSAGFFIFLGLAALFLV